MNRNKKTIFFSLFFFSILLMNAGFVYALEAKYPKIFGVGIGGATFPEYARYFFNLGIGLAGFIAICTIAFGGIYYLIDYARGKFKDEGKEWIKAGVLGLLIVTCAYLIAFTINPDLVIFRLNGLSIILSNPLSSNPSNGSATTQIYNEIPIGTLTETLLSRKIDCYDFDGNGDPINGDKIQTDNNQNIVGPTYLENDRVDCFLKLTKAADNKALIIKKLSDKITEQMNLCSCGAAVSNGGSGSGSSSGGSSPGGSSSGSSSYKGSSIILSSTTYSPGSSSSNNSSNSNSGGSTSSPYGTVNCQTNCGKNGADCLFKGTCRNGMKSANGCVTYCTDTCQNKGCSAVSANSQCCPADAKQRMEHGPLSINDCDGMLRDYKGLDEFRTQYNNDYGQIKQKVEIQPPPQVNKKQITVINNGNCTPCKNQCITCNPTDNKCLQTQTKCQQDLTKCQQSLKECLKKNSPWYNLRLIDQLTYLKGKMDEYKPKVQKDLDQLKKAETSLGQCYLADTYIDFLKTYQQTNKDEKVILVQRTFADPETNQQIIPAKYCQGFQYNNSTCYSQCQNVCPASAEDIKDCFNNAPTCDAKDKDCLTQQNDFIKNCQAKQKCTLNSTFNNFEGCMSSCKQQCLKICDGLCPGEDKTQCQAKCNNNSKCLLENQNKCLINVQSLKNCVKNSGTDNESLKTCADSAALCKYCSDQNAGYPDCLKNPYSLQGKYSSSFIYQNPDYQVCPEPNKTITGLNNDVNGNKITYSCIEGAPQTTKCPASSKCPECPCDTVDETFTYSSPATSNIPNNCLNTNTSKKTITQTTKDVSEGNICSGNCDASAYNDDPLTFYCQQSWWQKDETKNTASLGGDRICPKEGEIPVGQTIDDAEKWAQDFMDNMDKVTKKVQDMIQYVKQISQEKNYCLCESKCDSSGRESACNAKCTFVGADSYIDKKTGKLVPPSCACVRQACTGNPCQKMINLLQGKNIQSDCQKGIEYKGMDYYYYQINGGAKDFEIFTIQQNRSDVVKELSYSRKQTDACSVRQNNYGEEKRILSCTRAEDEVVYPVTGPGATMKTIINGISTSSYCYGKALGEILKTPEPLADNWFCCSLRQKGAVGQEQNKQ